MDSPKYSTWVSLKFRMLLNVYLSLFYILNTQWEHETFRSLELYLHKIFLAFSIQYVLDKPINMFNRLLRAASRYPLQKVRNLLKF